MSSRRNFLKTSGLALAGLSLSNLSFPKSFNVNSFQSKRPPITERKFISEAIETKITEMKKTIKDEELGWMFENCFPNTLDTTVTYKIINGKPDTFIITGDINAMWL
ncbi:MAG: glycoside hydrolase family 125 protein, partial [Ignavibacterium sp.]|nr:glycoside hydrolase family 125 protein [Ignavibacterium sp.]